MPYLTFLLSNRRLTCKAKQEAEVWTLLFDAAIEKPGGFSRFKLFCGREELNGYAAKGTVYISQRREEQQERDDASKPRNPGHIVSVSMSLSVSMEL